MQATKKLYDLQSLNFLRYSRLRVGVLGGSFNPAHSGHINISEVALKKFAMDYVIWLVANQNPLKGDYGKSITDRASDALNMVSNRRILVSTAEHDMKIVYAYDSISELTKRFPQIDFTWLMGIDNITHFHKWHRYKELAQLCKIIAFDRPAASRLTNSCRFLSKFKPAVANSQSSNIIIHRGKLSSVSSTMIRKSS